MLESHNRPGDRTKPQGHPDSVMITLSSSSRRLASGDSQAHVLLVELKEPAPVQDADESAPLGPSEIG